MLDLVSQPRYKNFTTKKSYGNHQVNPKSQNIAVIWKKQAAVITEFFGFFLHGLLTEI